jgi:hypothetical protein
MLELKTVELKKLEDNAACEQCQAVHLFLRSTRILRVNHGRDARATAHLLRFLKPPKV